MAKKGETIRISYASDFGWANGEAPSKLAGAEATFEEADGIDIFRHIGELTAGYSITEIASGVITDTPMHILPTADNTGASFKPLAYVYGDSGCLYKVTDEATPVASAVASVANPRLGLDQHKDYIYYAQSTNIGRYGDISSGAATNDATFMISLKANQKGVNINHPLHSWKGTLYVGDGYQLKSLVGSETTGTSGSVDLEMDEDIIITALEDDDARLLIGAGVSPVEDEETLTSCYLLIWNGTDESFSDKIRFPEGYINSIKVVDNEILVFGVHNMYRLVGRTFQLVKELGQRVTMGGASKRKGILYWRDNDRIRGNGTPNPQLPEAIFTPFDGTGTDKGGLAWMEEEKLWFGDSNKLYEAKTGSQTGKVFKSKMLSFGGEMIPSVVKVFLGKNLSSGDEVEILIYDEVGNSTTVANFSHSSYGSVNSLYLHGPSFSSGVGKITACQLGINFKSGSVRVRELIVEFEPVSQP